MTYMCLYNKLNKCVIYIINSIFITINSLFYDYEFIYKIVILVFFLFFRLFFIKSFLFIHYNNYSYYYWKKKFLIFTLVDKTI